jgi:N-acetyl sugar amidotransferase
MIKYRQEESQICSRGVWDNTVPGIQFDDNGVSNYAHMYDKLVEAYPRGEQGKKYWDQLVKQIKKDGRKKLYDCVIGISGGTDSCYLLYLATQYGLRPLAVNLDNGWNSDISVKNIKKVTKKLGIDLETYVINYEEIKDLLKSYMRSRLPWVDMPTDLAIKAVMYKIAAKIGVKYILRGNDFRSEGTQPREWTYGDARQLKHVHSRYGSVRLRTYPNYSIYKLVYYGIFKRIRSIYPFYYLDYNKKDAQVFLKKEFDWEYYGGHHHENIFTKFAISYWSLYKFGIDKRKITYSSQILSGAISRDEVLNILKTKPNTDEEDEHLISYVIKKLDMTEDEFKTILNSSNKSYLDYPSYYPLFYSFTKIIQIFSGLLFIQKPMMFFQLDMRKKNQ